MIASPGVYTRCRYCPFRHLGAVTSASSKPPNVTRFADVVWQTILPRAAHAVASCPTLNRQGPVSTDTTLYVPEPYRFHEISRTSMTASPASFGGAGTIA